MDDRNPDSLWRLLKDFDIYKKEAMDTERHRGQVYVSLTGFMTPAEWQDLASAIYQPVDLGRDDEDNEKDNDGATQSSYGLWQIKHDGVVEEEETWVVDGHGRLTTPPESISD